VQWLLVVFLFVGRVIWNNKTIDHCIGHAKDKEECFLCCDQNARAENAKSFTLWQQATIDITQRGHCIIACSRHICLCVALYAHPVCGESQFQPEMSTGLGLWSVCDPVVFAHLQCGLEPRNLDGTSLGSCWCRRRSRRIGQRELLLPCA